MSITFSARGKSPGEPRRIITLKNIEFIRRYLMHVLPPGFQKIRCKTAAFSPNGKDTFPIYILADPSAAWYNWKESHSEQFEFFSGLLFLCLL